MRWIACAALALLAITGTASANEGDYYLNRSGHWVHRPVHANRVPAGATAHCQDGTYSFSEHHRGTCSYHGGVESWLR
jgi:hypothetical protein